MTKQRKIIYEVVQASPIHMTAEEIFLQAKKRLPSLSIATVYRNLGLMVRDGEIRRISVGGADRYDRNTSPHDHLTCIRCGKLTDVTLKDLKATLEQCTGQTIHSYELNLYYTCPACMQSESDSAEDNSRREDRQ